MELPASINPNNSVRYTSFEQKENETLKPKISFFLLYYQVPSTNFLQTFLNGPSKMKNLCFFWSLTSKKWIQETKMNHPNPIQQTSKDEKQQLILNKVKKA
ncbi:hypothetical protein V6Z11_A10G124600 [Gossypium hirsutum]